MKRPAPLKDWTASEYVAVCPECGYDMIPMQSRIIDRLVSMLIPVHRFRCPNFLCGNECNIKG